MYVLYSHARCQIHSLLNQMHMHTRQQQQSIYNVFSIHCQGLQLIIEAYWLGHLELDIAIHTTMCTLIGLTKFLKSSMSSISHSTS